MGKRSKQRGCRWHLLFVVFVWLLVGLTIIMFVAMHRHVSLLAPAGDSGSTASGGIFGSKAQELRYRGPKAKQPPGWQPHRQPAELELRLPDEVINQKALKAHSSMLHRYGFNLNKSNHLPLLRTVPDLRNEACKARQWPANAEMPKASVIIIFYDEPLSTLLRNVVGVLNRSPPQLLGEVLLIDDHSVLKELEHLPEHLARLNASLPPGKVRLVRRETHDGIVGARNRGAKEALYPIIVILDSHAEVSHGWLEPLVARIHEDRTRVIVPNIVPINIESMKLEGGGTWPPQRGSFNWRLTFTIILADTQLDIIEHGVNKQASAIKSPVMPGGLFAMDREFYFELGQYDPEIRLYGAEHIEMSFRVWMCGGSMEISPCSHIGHIYREFDRFGVDSQIEHRSVGKTLDRNDARVAEVWMGDFKQLFYKFRPMPGMDLGDLKPREELRDRLQCKSFQWFLDNVCRDMYVPDVRGQEAQLAAADGSTCLGIDGRTEQLHLERCSVGSTRQMLEATSQGFLQLSTHVDHRLVCLRSKVISQVGCVGAPRWERHSNSLIASLDRPGLCLDRGLYAGSPDLQPCSERAVEHQRWLLKEQPGGGISVSDPDFALCIDNMQATSGAPGLYPCHGGGTQLWRLLDDGRLKSDEHTDGDGICLGFGGSVIAGTCQAHDENFAWERTGPEGTQQVKPRATPEHCLERTGQDVQLSLCRDGVDEQLWNLRMSPAAQ